MHPFNQASDTSFEVIQDCSIRQYEYPLILDLQVISVNEFDTGCIGDFQRLICNQDRSRACFASHGIVVTGGPLATEPTDSRIPVEAECLRVFTFTFEYLTGT